MCDLTVSSSAFKASASSQSSLSTSKMPAGKFIGWDKIKKFRLSHMMLMHALVYKREVLLESGMVLPEHTFTFL